MVVEFLLRCVRAWNIVVLARDAAKLQSFDRKSKLRPRGHPPRGDFREVTDAVRYSYSFPKWTLSMG